MIKPSGTFIINFREFKKVAVIMAKKSKLGVASAIVVGAGAAALYAKKDRKSTRLNSSHSDRSRMPSSA